MHKFNVGDKVKLRYSDNRDAVVTLQADEASGLEFEMACDTYRKQYDCEFLVGEGSDPLGVRGDALYLVTYDEVVGPNGETQPVTMPAYESELR